MTDVPVPSHRALTPKLGPTVAGAPTVIFDADPALPLHLRQQFCETVEAAAAEKSEVADVLIDEPFGGKPHMLVMMFAPGTKAYEALQLGLRFKAWFFQNLADADRRQQRKLRKGRSQARSAHQRHGRRHQRQEFAFCVRRGMVPAH